VSFYHLHHNTPNQPISLANLSKSDIISHPISSLAVFSKSTRDIFYIDKYENKSEEKSEEIIPENEPENIENPTTQENVSEVGNSPSINQSSNNSQNSRTTATEFRQYLDRLEKKNPFKEINTCGMRLSPCGRKILVGYSDQHLKFWDVFKSSRSDFNDLGLSLLSEWR
jgi:hypothetical protein